MSSLTNHNYVLIMAGGAGTRLWPISRQENPKQFQSFVGDQTLLQHMVDLARQVVPIEQILIMAVPKFGKIILQQIPDLPEENLLYEPARRDTGPAITLGMLQVLERDSKAKVAVLWSDHFIQNPEGFYQMLRCGFTTVTKQPESLVVVGVNPTFPNTAFGYIQMGKEVHQYEELPVFTVRRFTEKPDLETATRFVSSWDYLWNVGYEITDAANFIKKLRTVRDDLLPVLDALATGCHAQNKDEISTAYEELPKQSVEYLFTQRLDNLLVIPADLSWSDLGSWNILHDVLREKHAEGMVSRGEVMLVNTTDSLVYAKDRPIAVVGLKDVIVVDDGDVILVMHKSQSQQIKTLIQELEQNRPHLM